MRNLWSLSYSSLFLKINLKNNFTFSKAKYTLSYNLDKFYFIISINNILNHKYHNYAVASLSTNGSYNAYPEPSRKINFTVGIKF